jgi:hypothetical protein
MSSRGTTTYFPCLVTYKKVIYLSKYQELEVVSAKGLFEIVIDEEEYGQNVSVCSVKRLPKSIMSD